MLPLSQTQLTIGCYLTALVLNLIIAWYARVIHHRLGGEGVFARAARWTGFAGVVFAACDGVGAFVGADSLALASMETAGAGLLFLASYSLYTLVKV